MAFDLYDDPFGRGFNLGRNPFLPARPQQPAGPAVLPEEEADLLGGLMEQGLGGLAYVGKVLDKTFGGRAVRGVLGGRPRELLSVLPFSDTLGLTDESQTVHGKDLLEGAGVLTRGDNSFENTAAGVLADIALDPAMWVGAAVPKAVLGGLRAAAPPVLGAVGKATEKLTGGLVNPYTAGLKAGEVVGRSGTALFDPAVHGTWSRDVQQLARDTFDPVLKDARLQGRQLASDPLVEFAPYVKGRDEGEFLRAAVLGAEGFGPEASRRLSGMGFTGPEVTDILARTDRLATQVRATNAAEGALGVGVRENLDLPAWKTDANARAVAAGLPEPFPVAAQTQSEYFPRRLAQWPESGKGSRWSAGGGGELSAVGSSQTAREDFLRGLPFGTEGINTLVRDARFAGQGRTYSQLQAEDELTKLVTGGYGSGALPAGFPGDATAWAGAREQAKHLAEFLHQLPPDALKQGLYSTDVLGAGLGRLEESARIRASAEAVTEGSIRFARPVADLEASGQAYVRVPDVLNSAGLTRMDPVTGQPIAHANVMNALGLGNLNDLKNMAVPLDTARDMARMGQAYTVPGALAPVVEVWDKVSNFFKTALTTVFPAFHARNLMSGLFNQWRDGALSAKALGEAQNVIRGGSISADTARAMGLPFWQSPELATKELLKEAIAHKVAFVRDARQTSDAVGLLTARPGGMLPSGVPDVSGLRPISEDLGEFAAGFKGGGQTSWRRPLDIQGVNSEIDRFTPVAQGRKLGNTVEDFNRLSHYISKRTAGATPAEAAESVMKYQIDYGNLTQFEQNVMKRAFPWYTFSRRNLPPLLEDLATKPAKLTAAVHAATGSREPGEFVPPWIAEGAAVPIPGGPEGNRRFVSSFGLPFEDEAVKTIGSAMRGDTGRVFQQLFGMAQPLVKVPAELATGVQMFSGRKLEDLRPYEFSRLGGLVPEDAARQASQVIANSPLSRFGSSFDKLIDERKDTGTQLLNLGTGARVTDVDIDKVKQRAAQDLLKDLLRGQPGVKAREDVYVPKEQMGMLSQDDLMVYNLLREIEARAAARSRAANR